jgi:hypothetical protein
MFAVSIWTCAITSVVTVAMLVLLFTRLYSVEEMVTAEPV